jgi:PAS domain S-box-containing protein
MQTPLTPDIDHAGQRAILEGSPFGVSIVSLDSLKRLYVNQRIVELFGAESREQLLSQPLAQSFVDPADLEQLREAEAAGEPIAEFESERIRPDGTRWWARQHNRSIKFEGHSAVISWHEDVTEKRRTKATLDEKSAALGNVLDNIVQGVVMFNNSQRLVVWNKPFESIFQFPEDILRAGASNRDLALFLAGRGDFGAGEPMALAENRLREVWSSDSTRSEVNIRKDKAYDVRFNKTPDGGLVITYTDITERKRAEDALRESERQVRTITDSLPVLITYMSKERRVQYINKTAEDWYGRPTSEVVGQTVADLLGEETHGKLEPYIAKAIAGERVAFEETVTYPDRKTRNVQITFVPDIADGGDVRGYFGLVVDLTASKQAEAALLAAETYLSSAIDSISEGFILYDQDDKFVMCNDQYKDFYPKIRDAFVPGAKLEDLARVAFERGAVKGSAEFIENWMNVRFAQQRSGQGLLEQELPDGRWLLCGVRKTVGGYTAGIRTDITELKKAADDLRQAQKMEAMGQLTGGVAHDFNNLLAVIMGNLELLLARTELDSKNSTLVARAVAATQRGADLTDRLLAFSRKQPLQPVSIDINQLVKGMQELMVRTLGQAIEIDLVVGADLWQCEVDPGQLENAILNLSINARDAMPLGGRLTIEVSNARVGDPAAAGPEDSKPGEYILLAISDTGAGMSADVMEQAFEPFFTTKEVGKGSGLGLSMVYGFARQSDGHVEIHSEPDEGTTIKLYLPRSTTAPISDTEAGAQMVIDTAARGETVMVVEDDADVRAVAVSFLEALGYDVCEAGTADAALAQIRRNGAINLLLADVILPGGMDGRALADTACGLLPDLKVLYMSGYTKDAMIHYGRLDEGVQLLVKPFSKADLAVKVRQVLDGPY